MKYKAALFVTGFCAVFLSVFFATNAVFADQYGLDATAGEAGLKKGGTVPDLIGNVIGAGLSLISVLFFLLMIYAGIKWMTARGNEEASRQALDTIIAAIIGIVIVMAAYAITTFVFNSVGAQQGGGGAGAGAGGDGAPVGYAPGEKCIRNIQQDTDIANNINTQFCAKATGGQQECAALSFYGQSVCGQHVSDGCIYVASSGVNASVLDAICAKLPKDDCAKPVGGVQYCKLFNTTGNP